MIKNLILNLTLLLFAQFVFAQSEQVSVVQNNDGMKLVVGGEDFMVNGMNWDYFPIGTNYSYSLWKQPDDVIKAALDAEMSLLKNMGVNAVRQYTGVPAKWIKYIYEKYGIYTMLNHSFGRYGLTINGRWVPNTEYLDPSTQELLLSEVKSMTEEYKGTPGLLLYLLGNENNYGLFWEGAETEDIPIEDRKSTTCARDMYKLFNKAVVEMKAIDSSHPIAICNGDLLFLEIIVEECKDIDILGTNMYRGASFGDAFQRVKDQLNKPILFTEFGADAFSATENTEDQKSQAYYMTENWKEIYENAAGLGKANNSLGGFTFQFSDGWWKFGQTKNLEVHDNNASWSNGGYQSDFEEGENNMNEEWFGICAKGETNQRGLYELYPRAAYYALKEAHQLNPYSDGVTIESINSYFSSIQLMDAVIKARGDKAALIGEKTRKVCLSGLRADISTIVEPSLPLDFENGETLIPFDNGATATNISNPDNAGNPSSKVLEFKKVVGSAWYSGVVFDETLRTTPLIDLSNGTVFTIKIWSPNAGINVRFQLEGGFPDPGSVPSYEVFQTVNTANEWVTLTFDFTSQVNATHQYTKFSIFPDFNTGNQVPVSVESVYYIDDITQQ